MSKEINELTFSVMADDMKAPETESQPSTNGEMMQRQINADNAKTDSVSEYDSTENYTDRENGSHNGSESDGSIIFEREEGDGQESVPAKKVDDDEDKKNPQYIPKRGTFYEHDDRTADDMEALEAEKNDKESKKKVWQDKKEKWNHDRFNEMEQTPKSRAELISIYGYDIRNEDGPPRARRRRRYGRGPNKYTRNWEDVDAYGKPTVIRKGNKKSRPRSDDTNEKIEDSIETENFENSRSDVVSEENVELEKEQRISNDVNEDNKNIVISQQQGEIIQKQNISTYQHDKQLNKQTRVGTGRVSKPKREITDSDYRGFTKTRQFKSSPNTRIQGRSASHNSASQNNRNQNIHELEKDMSKINIQEGGNFKPNVKHNNPRQGSMPPRLQAEQKGSKRYSSIRQRSLPETANPPFPQHLTSYYANDYSQQSQTSQPQQTIITNTTLQPTNAPLPQMPAQTLPPIPSQVPVTTTPLLQAPPPQFAPPFPPAPPFLQPGVPQGPFIPQPPAPILNYVQSQPQYPQPPPYQGYQQPFNAVNQPAELYQPQGGITYYSTQEQQAAQRAAPPKRPKAAIPIVAPPPEHRGRGRTVNPAEPTANILIEHEQLENTEIPSNYEDAPEIAAQ